MVRLTQQEKQVVEAFRQLDPQRRRHVLLEMARADSRAWSRFQQRGEASLREAARQRGIEWDELDDQQRQDFVEELLDGRDE